MKQRILNYVWGIIIILLGIFILLSSLELIDFSIFFKGWWTLFIIIPSFVDLILSNHKMKSFNILLLGVLLLLNVRDLIENPIILFISMMIIELGLRIIFVKKTNKKFKSSINSDSYVGIFSETNACNDDKDFKGCSNVAVFGEVNLDLTKIVLTEDVHIDAVGVFGSVRLEIPKDIDAVVDGISIFGSNVNKKEKSNSKYKIYVSGVSIFGDIRTK